MPVPIKFVPYVSVVEIDGETHVMKSNGPANIGMVRRHLQSLHPEMKIISLEPADPKDPIGHIRRVAEKIAAEHPDQEPLTPERLTESANQAIAQQNDAAATKLT